MWSVYFDFVLYHYQSMVWTHAEFFISLELLGFKIVPFESKLKSFCSLKNRNALNQAWANLKSSIGDILPFSKGNNQKISRVAIKLYY